MGSDQPTASSASAPAAAGDSAREQSKGKWLAGTPAKDSARDLLSGMISGLICKLVEYPFDTVKVLEQTGGGRYSGPLDVVRQTMAEGGVWSLYRGLAAPLIGSMAECASLFVAYGHLKTALGVDEEGATLSCNVPMWKYVLAGGGSGVASTCVLTPVELIKCTLQAQLHAEPSAPGSAAGGARPAAGALEVIARIVRSEGVLGLWRGTTGTLAREVPGNMAWFGAYEAVMRAVQRRLGYERKGEVPLGWSAFAGSWAGVAYWAVPYPADTLKSRIQTDERFRGVSLARAGAVVLRDEGVGGLYRGVGVTCARAAPSHALIFFFYELASQRLARL